MASSSFDALLASLVDDVTCHVCFEVFHDPRELPCRHTLCFNCYTKMHADNKGLVTCPLCLALLSSSPSDLPVDRKVQKVVDHYRQLQREKERSGISTCGSVVSSNCSLHGCTLHGISLGPSSGMQLCTDHYRNDLKKFEIRCNRVKKSVRTRVDEYLLKELDRLKSLLASMEDELEKVGEMFRELEKNLRLKREELEVELDARIRSLDDLIKSQEKELKMLTENDSNLTNFMDQENFISARETVDHLEFSLDTLEISASCLKFSKATCLDSLSSLFNYIKKTLPECRLREATNCYVTTTRTFSSLEIETSIDLSETIHCLAVCSNTNGYLHNPTSGDEAHAYRKVQLSRELAVVVEMVGYVEKRKLRLGSTSTALPKEVLLVSFECEKYGISVYAMCSGKVVLHSFISFERSRILNGFEHFSCDSVNQRLFLSISDWMEIVCCDLAS